MEKESMSLSKFVKINSEQGIKADAGHLLRDIISQFSDHRECYREYVVNASDAKADWCRVSGSQDGEIITIVIQDNGHGMDKQRVIDFMTLFRSIKEGDAKKAVGQFGVGKASILAIPGLTGFVMVTSTGKEAWQMELASFLDDKPVHVKPVKPVPPHGTRFSITFVSNNTLSQELHEISDILYEYARFLPMTITVQNLGSNGDNFVNFRHINASWSPHQERLGRRFTFSLGDAGFEVVIALGHANHEIYQNKVKITSRYNLFSHDLSARIHIPNITLRVDSRDFELPFGRHGLRNEEILSPLSRYLRKTILPIYFDELYETYQQGRVHASAEPPMILIEEIEELACTLLNHDLSPGRKWASIPLFAIWGQPRVSFNELQEQVDESGRLYIEDADNIGVDYGAFDGPVLSAVQPPGAMTFLKDMFSSELINLGLKDMVLEQPENGKGKLGKTERNFESFLGFHPELLERFSESDEEENGNEAGSSSAPGNFFDLVNLLQKNSGLNREANEARIDLEEISWRVNYLVERDGTTPCVRCKFLFTNACVVLNLHHPEVAKLLAMSAKLPALAGHWALALCLEDDKKILPHLTPAGREDLMRLDALVRSHVPPEKLRKKKKLTVKAGNDDQFLEHLRSLYGEIEYGRMTN